MEADSVSADARRLAVPQVLARVHLLEQRTGWVVFVHKSALGFSPPALSEDGVH